MNGGRSGPFITTKKQRKRFERPTSIDYNLTFGVTTIALSKVLIIAAKSIAIGKRKNLMIFLNIQ